MAKKTRRRVIPRGSIIVPASVIGAEEDKALEPGKSVLLPAAYAEHLVADKFADWPEQKGKPVAAPQDDAGAGQGQALTVEDAEAALEVATTAEDIEKALDDLTAAKAAEAGG